MVEALRSIDDQDRNVATSKKMLHRRPLEGGRQSAGCPADEEDIGFLARGNDRRDLVPDVNAKFNRDTLSGGDLARQHGEPPSGVGHARADQHLLVDETTHATVLHRLDDVKERQAGMSLCRENRCLSHRVRGTFRKGRGDQDPVDRFHGTSHPANTARDSGE